MRRRIAIGRLTHIELDGLRLHAGGVELVLGWSDLLGGHRIVTDARMRRRAGERILWAYVEFDEFHRAHGVRLIQPGGAIFEVAA